MVLIALVILGFAIVLLPWRIARQRWSLQKTESAPPHALT
jgi:hypothetical protein